MVFQDHITLMAGTRGNNLVFKIYPLWYIFTQASYHQQTYLQFLTVAIGSNSLQLPRTQNSK